MDVSKLTIDPHKLRFEKLTHKQKTKLRRQNVIDYINSKPYGTPITLAEFTKIAGFRTTSSAHSLITKMTKTGILTRTDIDARHKSYSVNGDVKITKAAAPKFKESDQPKDSTPLVDLAKEFAWSHNSDSLREFIKYMEGRKYD